jgi:hypothetical protein
MRRLGPGRYESENGRFAVESDKVPGYPAMWVVVDRDRKTSSGTNLRWTGFGTLREAREFTARRNLEDPS